MRNGLIYGLGITLATIGVGLPFATGCMTSGTVASNVGQTSSADDNSDGGYCVEGTQPGTLPVSLGCAGDDAGLPVTCGAGQICNYIAPALPAGGSGSCAIGCAGSSIMVAADVTYAWNCDQTPCNGNKSGTNGGDGTCIGSSSCNVTFSDSCFNGGHTICQPTALRETSITVQCQ